ncbi:hypothetical protein PCANC_19248 [Puccinia coronata f. sp. avenae]|nr:hypothetical protein PCASD_13667 [Puccinia coronata f. sp. avenae]PLW36500.1 hypothetical protein PCANC_19248 [Puccinia coronata f. sp. avenae]
MACRGVARDRRQQSLLHYLLGPRRNPSIEPNPGPSYCFIASGCQILQQAYIIFVRCVGVFLELDFPLFSSSLLKKV